MKAFIRTAMISCALAVPAVSFAQSEQAPITRAEVRADLIRLEQAGYRPGGGDNANYPQDIQAAQAKVQAEDAAAKAVAANTDSPSQAQMQQATRNPPMASAQLRIDGVRNPFDYGA
jgi:multidrug resistance efflux pump